MASASVDPSDGVVPTVATGPILGDVHRAVDLFLSNRFADALALGDAAAAVSPFHALIKATVLTLQAVMTMAPADADHALDALDDALALTSRFRRRASGVLDFMAHLFVETPLSAYSVNEIYAELLWAQAVLLRAAVHILVEQSFMNLIRSAVNVRTAYNAFQTLSGYVATARQAVADGTASATASAVYAAAASDDFVSGVLLGSGAFDLVLSLAPSSAVPVMKLFGFSGSRPRGLAALAEGGQLNGYAARICDLILLMYRLILVKLLAIHDSPLEDVERILSANLERYPTGALFLYFRGKRDQILHEREAAIRSFEAAIGVELAWTQLHHICYWELVWSHATLQQWEAAASYAEKLLRDSKWSPATYAYLQGAMLLMVGRKKEAGALFKQLPPLKQKILGKSLPMEKFVLRKGRKFFMQSEHLLLPALEIMYTFGLTHLLGAGAVDALNLVRPEIDRLRKAVTPAMRTAKAPQMPGDGKVHLVDDYALALLLAAHLERERTGGDLAVVESYLRELFAIEHLLTLDHYVAPFAHAEQARVHMARRDTDLARKELAHIRSAYKHYSNEPQLQMRLHVMQQELDDRDHQDRRASAPF